MKELQSRRRLLFAVLFVVCANLLTIVNGAEILIMPSSIHPVHRFTMRHLAEELIKRGHSVTWFEYGLKKPEIPLPKSVNEIFVQIVSENQAVKDLYLHRNHSSITTRLWDDNFWNAGEQNSGWMASIELCDRLLQDPKSKILFQQLVVKKYDSVVVDDLYNPLTDELNFFQRGYNLAAYLRQLYVHQHIVLRRIDALIKKHYPKQNLPEAFTLERNASINFVNHPPIFDFARPFMPRVNFVGGLHCKKAAQLPKDLEKFVSASNDNHGFILITGGFTLQWKYAPEQVVENLLEAIRTKSEIQFVWQYNGPALKNPPKNLYVDNWLPQQDLLGHPKCRAHISHGGLNSVIESTWHGVPIIGWPLTISGYDNLLRVTARQAGLMMDTKKPTPIEFVSIINRIYIRYIKEEMLLFQDMLVDVPYTELNHSAFWVEFIVRHQEVPHARSGADELNILQYFLVDVIAFVLVLAVVALAILIISLKLLVRLVVFLIKFPFRKNHKISDTTNPKKIPDTANPKKLSKSNNKNKEDKVVATNIKKKN